MKLFIVGGNSPTGKDLIEILRKHKVRFQAPPDKHFDPDNALGIARMVTDWEPTQLINLADFISGNHGALKRAESALERCTKINERVPATLAEICNHLDIPMLHLSNAYVFDGRKKLAYNENDEAAPVGVYGRASLEGEQAVRRHRSHLIIRSGWLFGEHKKWMIKSWIRLCVRNAGRIQVVRRRLSPTFTGDLAAAILAVCRQVDCGANVWGTYHYSGLETKKESEFVTQTLKYAANHDEQIYQLLGRIKLVEVEAAAPEIYNSTFSGKRIFDTFGIKQKSWHANLREVIKSLYGNRLRSGSDPDAEAAASRSTASSVA